MDDSLIDRARAMPIDVEAIRLGATLKRTSKVELVGPCPVCGGRDRFSINTRKGVFHCRGCATGGDVIDLVRHVGKLDFSAACEVLVGTQDHPRPTIQQRVVAAPVVENPNRFALDLWDQAAPIEGTIAERYLRDVRRLEIPDDAPGHVIRFHPECPFLDYGQDPPARIIVPAMLALWRKIEGDEPVAIHRTALAPDGRKANLPKPKLSMGPTTGAAIKLTADENISYGLTIAEGIETALAGMAEGFRPAWVVGIGGIRNFPVLAAVDCLTILVDNDLPDRNGRRAGPDAADVCRERWTAAGREVRLVVPRDIGRDMADLAGAA